MLRLEDDWVWDSWVADDGELFHLFFLHAPRSLVDPGERHTAATVGHATSVDLVSWTFVGDALRPDPHGWDDLALWTGSVLRGDDGRWRMFYTALNTEHGHGVRDQRIGVAESDDLTTWTRVLDRPAVEADGRWYKTLPEDPGASETWRDPFVFRGTDGWQMLVTARVRGAAPNDDGVLASARSADLVHWEVGPPVSTPGGTGFGQLEVAQVHEVEGTHLLVFTCHPQEQTAEHVQRHGRYCTWSVAGPAASGPWDVAAARPFTAEPDLFAAPLVRRRDGSWVLVGFRNLEPQGIDAFEIIDPVPVTVRDGVLVARP